MVIKVKGMGEERRILCTSAVASGSSEIALRVSFERTYQGHFGAWVDSRSRVGKTSFLRFEYCVIFVGVCGICVYDQEVAAYDR